jgi:hypothetical protein
MKCDAYLATPLSPYTLNGDAMKLIEQLNSNFSVDLERKIIILINAATSHPSMSHYQLSLTHKALGDCYFEHEYYGSALEQYNRALAYNQKLSVKRRMNKILSMVSEDRKVSLSPDIVDDVLQYPEYAQILKDDADLRKRATDALWVGHENFRAIFEKAEKEVIDAAKQDNRIYDPAHDAEVARRLDALGEPYKTWFLTAQEKRRLTYRDDDPLSLKEYDLLELQDLERNKELYSKKK